MNKKLVPFTVSSLRLLVLPLFIYFYMSNDTWIFLGLLIFCAATDYLDGYLARRLAVSSKVGAYYDAATDFTLMFGIYTLFVVLGLYSLWFVFLLAVAFAQFILTSLFARKLYDLVGRYLGSTLYIGAALTLLVPAKATFLFVQYAFLFFFLVSFASRIFSFIRKPTKSAPP